MLPEEIEKLLQSYSPPLKSVISGKKLGPKEVLILSSFYKDLNLRLENILMVSSKVDAPKFLLTDKHLFFNKEKIPALDFNIQLLDTSDFGFLDKTEIEVLKSGIDLLRKKKAESRKTIDSFLDKYKHILVEDKVNHKNPDLFFDGSYIEMLQHEAEEVKRLCEDLNKDPHFIQSLNLIFSSTDEAVDGFTAEHLLISDIIRAYNQVVIKENEKSKFTLAYYFEGLQGKDMAKGISIQRLNQMTTNESFMQNIEKIKSAKFIHTNSEYKDEYLLSSILFRIKHDLFMKSGNCIYRFASIVAKADGTVNDEEKAALKDLLDKTTKPKVKTSGVKVDDIPDGDTIEAVMYELDSLVGLEEVKKSIKELTNLLKVQKIRTEKGMPNIDVGLHSVFMGPPGTGKTTIARLLGRLYKHLGFLEKGHMIETDRAGMVAGFVGQTAIKVNDIVNESIDGVLFIDEAYALTPPDGGKDFGGEAVDTLLKRMEDLRKQLVVVVAGYTEPMKLFVESNPGLRSRFNRFFKFNHFLPVQLLQIYELFCKKSDFIVSEDAKVKLLDTFELLYEKRDEGFGNARVVRNLFERCIQTQANRIVLIPEITEKILQSIEEGDIPEPKSTIEQVYFTKSE